MPKISGRTISSRFLVRNTYNTGETLEVPADALGIHNVFRYAFGKPTGDFALLGITFNNDGKAVVVTPPLLPPPRGGALSG